MTAIEELTAWLVKSEPFSEAYKQGLKDAITILEARKKILGKAISVARKGIPNKASAENGKKRKKRT